MIGTNDKLINQARAYIAPVDIQCVIYHSPCPDGFASAFSAWKNVGDNADYMPMDHGMIPNMEKLANKNVLIVDFSFPLYVIEEIISISKKMLLLDHHKTALEDLKDISGCFFDMNRSGAMLAWNYFHDVAPPKLIKYIQDRDLWSWKFKEGRFFHAALDQFHHDTEDPFLYDFRSYSPLLEDKEVQRLIDMGAEVFYKNQEIIQEYTEQAIEYMFIFQDQEYTIFLLEFSDARLVSELADSIQEKSSCDFVMIWHQDKRDKFKVSLRSKNTIDVSEIARSYGGGGHQSASGMILSLHPRDFLELTSRSENDT
jgi:uncharacterized protein